MSYGELAFLALVLAGFGAFVGSVGFISIWSALPAKRSHPTTTVVTTLLAERRVKKAA